MNETQNNDNQKYFSHPDQDPNSMIPHHESFGTHWYQRHHYFMWIILVLLLAAILSVVYWWQADNFRISVPIMMMNQDKNNAQPETSPMAMLKMHGGLCMEGAKCETVLMISETGVVYVNDEPKAELSDAELDTLVTEISSVDFARIKGSKFSGTCPIAFDGQESTYTFYLASDMHVLPDCTYQIDESKGAFKTLKSLIEKYAN
jgi:hypothetical protein